MNIDRSKADSRGAEEKFPDAGAGGLTLSGIRPKLEQRANNRMLKRMSPGDKAERMAHLRSAIAGLEAHPGPARAGAPPRLSVAPALDPALGGGLSGDALHEIAPAQAGD